MFDPAGQATGTAVPLAAGPASVALSVLATEMPGAAQAGAAVRRPPATTVATTSSERVRRSMRLPPRGPQRENTTHLTVTGHFRFDYRMLTTVPTRDGELSVRQFRQDETGSFCPIEASSDAH